MREPIDEAIARVVGSGWYVLGPEHDAFESELASYLGVGHTIAVGNGTDALQLALAALGVGSGDTVLTAANAGGYTSTAVRSLGGAPVFADIDPHSHLLSIETLKAAVEALPLRPRAIVVTHLYGAAAGIHDIVEWAHALGLRVVEDCAQSLGAVVGGVRAGSVGDLATTSFYPTKNLGALGDGGAVFTSDPELAVRVRRLRQYGWQSKYRTTITGGRNSRLDELQAAILRVKLPHLNEWNERRRLVHNQYELAVGAGARLVNTSNESFVGHLAVIETSDRARAQSILTSHRISFDVHYPVPDHLQPVEVSPSVVALPVTEAAAQRVLSVPLFPELTDDEISRVSDALSEL